MTSKKPKGYISYKRYCCAYGCLNKRKNNDDAELTFFQIPEDIERRKQWLAAIDREDLLDEKLNKAKKNYICSAHFDESAIITSIARRLKSDAVPSKLLPDKSQANIPPDPPTPVLTIKIKNTFSQTLPQTSHSSREDIWVPGSTCQSQIGTQAQNHTLVNDKNIELEKDKLSTELKLITQPKVTNSTSTQTDLNKTSNKMTQTTSEEPLRKINRKKQLE